MEQDKKQAFLRAVSLAAAGGLAYNLVEICWRGRTHWTMTLVGGLCFHLIGRIFADRASKGTFLCCLQSAAAVTAVELLGGCVINLWWRMQVWDYSRQWGNLAGQICLLYAVLWMGLSLPAAYLYRRLGKAVDAYLGKRHKRTQNVIE